jgi:exopolysaccharide biosynthesis polyprenyl glycosylphosphotransferase
VSYGILSQELFVHTLYVERKRTERSGRSFVLMLLESARLLKPESDHQAIDNILLALFRSSRDTDIKGWYRAGKTIGVVFTELGAGVDAHHVASSLLSKVRRALTDTLGISQLEDIRLSCHVFPETDEKSGLYDELLHQEAPKRLPRIVKRFIDIAGSCFALLFFLPLFIAIAIAVKLTSKGPVLFCQERVGRYGKKFRFLKFRSMCVNNDSGIHQEFVKRLIVGDSNGSGPAHQGAPVYKLTADPRVTPIGRFLRKSSLDELPQFLNVLKGEMSLVGPRPPLPYEADCYRLWHRTRLLAAKPGITGLWQVSGRSRVKFDEMVRMDLRYANSWSLWLDLKILIRTPQAVLFGNGAY